MLAAQGKLLLVALAEVSENMVRQICRETVKCRSLGIHLQPGRQCVLQSAPAAAAVKLHSCRPLSAAVTRKIMLAQ